MIGGDYKVYLIYSVFLSQMKDTIQVKTFSCGVVSYLQMFVSIDVMTELQDTCSVPESAIEISYVCNNCTLKTSM